ncbi:MAG TPA: NAD(P)/FAD-dependent oxidoreductase [Candidatus Saccharimonadales bacterium]|nr:NAD(P)/FAD-dependent oxidoreductase [Candidatus Saccharimonadales bacterium]
MKYHSDVLILGAGAAGLMCAIEAGKRGRSVTVLESSNRAGQKILISGGGRCNFTNIDSTAASYISANPHFAKSALARYTPENFIAMVDRHRIGWHEKKLGQLFCDRSAQDILTMLEEECVRVGVRVKLSTRVKEIRHDSQFTAVTGEHEFSSNALVIATGGLTIPKMGATPFGYEVARQFGIDIVEPRPALVAFTLNSVDVKRFCDLTGVSTEVIASIGKKSFREKMLITHHGFSGPAILQISSYWKPGEKVTLDIAPEREVFAHLLASGARREAVAASAALREVLPIRLAERWLELHPLKKWTNPAFEEAERLLHHFEFVPSGTEGFAKAEVTAGGVDTNELSAKTMESRKVPGLYFVGEVVDVTGHLGGYNFQWAWASGFSAGQAV